MKTQYKKVRPFTPEQLYIAKNYKAISDNIKSKSPIEIAEEGFKIFNDLDPSKKEKYIDYSKIWFEEEEKEYYQNKQAPTLFFESAFSMYPSRYESKSRTNKQVGRRYDKEFPKQPGNPWICFLADQEGKSEDEDQQEYNKRMSELWNNEKKGLKKKYKKIYEKAYIQYIKEVIEYLSEKKNKGIATDDEIEYLKTTGIRRVFYTNNFGELVYEFLNDMPKLHYSSGYNYMKRHNDVNIFL